MQFCTKRETITPVKAAALLARPGEGIEECLERVERPVNLQDRVIRACRRLPIDKATKVSIRWVIWRAKNLRRYT